MTIKDEMNYTFKGHDGIPLKGLYTHDAKNTKLVIILHGLLSTRGEYLYIALRDELIKKGYDVFIPEMYSHDKSKENKTKRSILNITTKRHIEDLEDMIAHFKKKRKYKKLFAMGHSFSGRILLTANNKNLAGQVLIDPSGKFDANEPWALPLKGAKQYIGVDEFGNHTLIGKKVLNEFLKIPFSKFVKYTENLNVPTLFAVVPKQHATHYKPHIPKHSTYVEIIGATHNFPETGTVQKLATETVKFFGKLSG